MQGRRIGFAMTSALHAFVVIVTIPVLDEFRQMLYPTQGTALFLRTISVPVKTSEDVI